MALLRFDLATYCLKTVRHTANEGRSCHNAAPMVLFCFGGMVSKSFDGDKYAIYETSLNLQIFNPLVQRLKPLVMDLKKCPSFHLSAFPGGEIGVGISLR